MASVMIHRQLLPSAAKSINTDFHEGKSINIFGPREAHGYWKTSEGL
jgi:hypothetical protein